jgi:D-aspartate ligase
LSKQPSVLIVDGESSFAPSVVWCLAAAGLPVHILSRAIDVPIRASRHASSFHTWRARSGGSLIDHIAAVAGEVEADVCMAIDSGAIRRLAFESPALPFLSTPVPSVVSFDTAYDKWQLACLLEQSDLPHPETRLCTADRSFMATIGAMRFPVLLKPRRGGNGVGITRFRTPEELLAHLRDHPSACLNTIVQNEIAGRDVDCSVLCENGKVLAHTIQRGLTEPSDCFRPSGAVEFVEHDGVLRLVTQLMSVLNWSGVAHIDLRENLQSGQVDVIEVNPRFWGSVLGSLHAGVNFPQLIALTALGLPHPQLTYRSCRYASGSTAVRTWLRTEIADCRSWFGIGETALIHSITDPGPQIAEWLSRCGMHLSGSFDAKVRETPGARN